MSKHKIFIDESCHLEHDHSDVMCIGYIKVSDILYEEIKEKINDIKKKHFTSHEIKWNSCSVSRLQLYLDLIDLFFDSELFFRSIVVKYKHKLDHPQFSKGSHDNFYYKMIYFLLNNPWLNPETDDYQVFIDIKDTRGKDKLLKIKEVFSNFHNGKSPFIYYQHIRSNESVFLQLVDIFIGAITYKVRNLHSSENANPAKIELINHIERRSGYSIDEGTEPWEKKFNIFDHQPKSSK